MIGRIETAPSGGYQLFLKACRICSGSHTTHIYLAEAKFRDGEDIYPYYTRCPQGQRIIMLKSTNGEEIEVFLSDDLLKLALARSDEPK